MSTQPDQLDGVELLPCPFCGDTAAHIWTPAHGGYSVICGNGCGAEGAVMESEWRAAEAWNRRSSQAPQPKCAACNGLGSVGPIDYNNGKPIGRDLCHACNGTGRALLAPRLSEVERDAKAMRRYYVTAHVQGFVNSPSWHELAEETRETYRHHMALSQEKRGE